MQISVYVMGSAPAFRLKARLVSEPGVEPEEKFKRIRAKSKADANKAAEEWKKELRANPAGTSRGTVAEFVDTYMAEVASVSLGLSARRDAEYVLRMYVVPVLGKVPLAALGPEHVDKVLAAGRKRGLGFSSLVKIRAKISRLCNVAMRRRLIASNPVALTDPPRDDRPAASRRVKAGTLDSLLEAVAGHWVELPILISLGAGLRRGEICGLQRGDIELTGEESGVIHVRRKIVEAGGKQAIEAPKRRSFRTIEIAGELVVRLRRHLAETGEAIGIMMGREPGEEDWLFLGRDGDFLHPNSISHAQIAFFRQVGLPKGFGLHAMRHTHASELLDAGVPLQTVSERLGHGRKSITADFYLHGSREMDRKAAEVAAGLRRRKGEEAAA